MLKRCGLTFTETRANMRTALTVTDTRDSAKSAAGGKLVTLTIANWPTPGADGSGKYRRPAALLKLIDAAQTRAELAPLRADITEAAFGFTAQMTSDWVFMVMDVLPAASRSRECTDAPSRPRRMTRP